MGTAQFVICAFVAGLGFIRVRWPFVFQKFSDTLCGRFYVELMTNQNNNNKNNNKTGTQTKQAK